MRPADLPPPDAPRLRVREVRCGVRDMRLRLPFRFGAVTLERCPQLFLCATVELADGRRAQGMAAEMMVPRWFDKRAGFAHADNVRDLQRAVERAVAAYEGEDSACSAFALFARHYPALMAEGAAAGATELSAAFGQAVLDRAVLDGLCRAVDASFPLALQRNLPGLADSAVASDLAGWDWHAWLAGLAPARAMQARHTVGMLDPLDDPGDAPADGHDAALPTSLAGAVRRYGHRFFKIKLGGEPAADLDRLDAVLATLDAQQPGHQFTLDGNEQYASLDRLARLCEGLRRLPRLAARPQALRYLEQPLPREASFDPALKALDAPAPLLLDEGDGTLGAFEHAAACGWQGVSSKGCKGLYKALLNRARCERHNRAAAPAARRFISAEDLTCQAGLAVQQDLALGALLGLAHCERNGHHYVDGFGPAPAEEAEAFARAHPDLYDARGGRVRLAIRAGAIALGSVLDAPGFGHAATPDFDTLMALDRAPGLV